MEPILALVFQAEHPGMFNCTTLSLARATLPKHTNKMHVKNTPNILFIFHPMLVSIFFIITPNNYHNQIEFTFDRQK
ncbi:hypothetical protein DS62_08150 [Smithella sp. SC_K08D17]|nr:hypothetical protein DS62_08150 [Smithella sp. SC_K08D17]